MMKDDDKDWLRNHGYKLRHPRNKPDCWKKDGALSTPYGMFCYSISVMELEHVTTPLFEAKVIFHGIEDIFRSASPILAINGALYGMDSFITRLLEASSKIIERERTVAS